LYKEEVAISNFIQTFGNSPKVLVLDFLLDNDQLDYCKSDIAEQTGLSRATLDRYWDELVKSRIILKSRQIGRARLFKLNKKLPLVQKLLELDNFLNKKQEVVVKCS
jgi:DNA-binding transcriptional ArsR family regulator